ncbi:MAG: discoidin domain-containing protein, partial [Solirubrobacteraceae bacterium]
SGLLGPVALRPERRADVELEPVRGERLLEIEAEPLALAPGQSRPARVRVRDLSGRSGEVALEVTGEGVSATPATTTVRLGQDGEGEAEIAVSAPVDAALPGQAALVLRAEGVEHRVLVRIAAATRLGRASASSSYPGRPPELAIDGITDSGLWDQGQGWNDGTAEAYPDELTVAFDGAAPIGRVRVHTLDSTQYPASGFGIADFDVQLRTGGEWRTVGELRGNDRGVVELELPAIEADAVRLVIHAARVSYSRVIELEALPR